MGKDQNSTAVPPGTQPASGSARTRESSIVEIGRIFFRVLGQDIRAEAGRLGLTAICIALWSFSMILVPVLVQAIVDVAIPRADYGFLIRMCSAVILVLAAATVFLYLQGRFGVTACEAIMRGLRRRLVDRILSQAWNLSGRFGSSDLIARFTQDTELVAESLYELLVRSIMGALYPLILLTYLLIWDWRFGLIAVAILPGYAYYYATSQKILTRASRPAKERLSRQTSVFLDLVQGATEIRIFHQEDASRKRFVEASDAYTGAATTSRRRYDASRTWMDMIGITVTYSPVLIGGFLILGGSDGLTAGMLLACMTHLRLLTMRLTLIFYGMAGLAITSPSLKRIAEVLDCPDPPSPPLVDTAEIPDEFSLEFENMSFSHEDGRTVFHDLRLRIAAGEKVAIMGPSGSGKSTLLQLLLRLRKPSGGKILLGGRDIESYPLHFYLSLFSYVGQKTHLFRLSVRENIAMGWYNVPESPIRDAVTRVRMHDAIMQLPEGYDTVLGEGGVELSGGQIQRLALARALIRDPAILILDEFTSAMDHQVEKDILDDLFAISEGRSLVCVTHSDAVAQRFDRIMHLDVLQGSTGLRS